MGRIEQRGLLSAGVADHGPPGGERESPRRGAGEIQNDSLPDQQQPHSTNPADRGQSDRICSECEYIPASDEPFNDELKLCDGCHGNALQIQWHEWDLAQETRPIFDNGQYAPSDAAGSAQAPVGLLDYAPREGGQP